MFHKLFRAAAVRLCPLAVTLVALVAPAGGASAGQIVQSFSLGPIIEGSSFPNAPGLTFPLVPFVPQPLVFDGFDPSLGSLLGATIGVTGTFIRSVNSTYTQLPVCRSGLPPFLPVTCGGVARADLTHELSFDTPIGTLSTFIPPLVLLDRSGVCSLPGGRLLPQTCLINFALRDLEVTGLLTSMGTSLVGGIHALSWGIGLQHRTTGAYDFGSTNFFASFMGQLDVTYNYASATPPPTPTPVPAPASGALFMLGLAILGFARRRWASSGDFKHFRFSAA